MGRVVHGKLSTRRAVYGASCLCQVVHGINYPWGKSASCPWDELSMGPVVHGASCPRGKLSMAQVVHGARSSPWSEMSWG